VFTASECLGLVSENVCLSQKMSVQVEGSGLRFPVSGFGFSFRASGLGLWFRV
jgi:hypothetical protein